MLGARIAMLLFVYGTLREPERLSAVLGRDARSQIVGPGSVRGVLYDAGEYPALRPSDSPDDMIPGVLLELGDEHLVALDRYEGVDAGLYVRERVAVHLANGTQQVAWSYVYNRPVSGLRRIAAWPPPGGERC